MITFELQHLEAGHLGKLVVLMNAPNDQIHIVSLIGKRTCKPHLCQRNTGNRKEWGDNTDFHLKELALRNST